MGVTWSKDPASVFSQFQGRIKTATERGLMVASSQQAQRIRESFLEEGKRDSGPEWIPTTFTAAINRKNPKFPSDPDFHTLVDTGTLKDSIRTITVDAQEKRVDSFVGSGVAYAEDMHFGTTFEGNDVPARPFMYLTDEDDDKIRADIETELAKEFA